MPFWLFKARDLPKLPISEKTAHEAAKLAIRAPLKPSQLDTYAQIHRARALLDQLRVLKKIPAADAARFEARLIRASDEEAARTKTADASERRAATAHAGLLLRDIAMAGNLSVYDVATYEAQIHSLEVSLGMGWPQDEGDPMKP